MSIEELVEIINTHYNNIYGHPLIPVAHRGPEMKKKIDLLYSSLISKNNNDIFEFYATTVLSYIYRSFNFAPSVDLIGSPKFIKTVLERYDRLNKYTVSEQYMLQNLQPLKKRTQGLFFGYTYNEMTLFSPNQAPEISLVKIMLERDNKDSFTPSELIIDLLDKVFFNCLGNNYNEEIHGRASELITDYAWLDKVLDLKKYFNKKLYDSHNAKNIYEAMGYKITFPLGKIKIGYCEALLWLRGLKQNDQDVINLLVASSGLKLVDLKEVAQYIDSNLRSIQTGIGSQEWPKLKQAMMQTELPKAQRRLIEFRTKGEKNEK